MFQGPYHDEFPENFGPNKRLLRFLFRDSRGDLFVFFLILVIGEGVSWQTPECGC